MRKLPIVLAATLALAVPALLAACGGGDDRDDQAPSGERPPPMRGVFAPRSVWNAALPRDVAFAADRVPVSGKPTPVNPAVGRELQAHATKGGRSNTSINVHSYTAPVTQVPKDQPLVPVKVCFTEKECVPSWAQHLDRVFRGVAADGKTPLGGGVPVPDDFVPPKDSDAEAVFYQPGYVAPDGKKGRLYELWKVRRNEDFDPSRPVSPDNTRWEASWGGRMVGVAGQGPGLWKDCWWYGCGHQADTKADPDAWGRPDSQAQQKSWGPAATSLPLLGTLVNLEDCRRGAINHAVGVQVPEARREHWWPARRTDGYSDKTAIIEGMRLTFPRDAERPGNLTKLGAAVWDAAYRYGMVLDDRTWSFLNLRADPRCTQTDVWGGVPAYEQLRNFPWKDLRVITQGSDATPTPTSSAAAKE